ncbi:hypothetical protein BV511_03175 [Methylorubrum extorquens]|uniref:tape measure protein n=1 Tax=Methylorubrum extorquens TaxID=408 RepID=UPI000972B22D|nr:tape measure protein [Methylorubrum extorquens]APX83816.1 hypothetical protein BV511_03175 [Methylorubrum extorquens]
MATDLERLVVSLEANIKKYERELARSRGVADGALRDVERTVSDSAGKIETQMGRVGSSIRNGIATALASISVGKLAELVDSNTKVQNSLKVSGLTGEELAKTYDQLFASAQRNGTPLEALSTLYGRLSLAQKELNVTAPELIKFTDGVALALRVSGQSATEASGALLQLSQALGGGKIQAEEYNSLIDGAQPVLRAVAAGLEEAGGSVSKLTALVKDGKVSSEAFFRAFEAGRPVLDEMASSTAPTISQELQRVTNALSRVVGEMSEAAEATKLLKQAFDALISVINEAPKVFEQDLKDLAKIADAARAIGDAVRYASSTIAVLRGQPLPQESDDPPPLAIRVRPPAPKRTIEGEATGPIKTVSLKSFKVPGEKDKKEKGSKDKVDEYEREVASIEKRTRGFDSEREAIGKSAAEVAKAEAAFRLLEAAKKANVPVTDELRTKIDTLSTAYANAKVRLDEAEEAQQRAANAQRYFGAAMTDALSDLAIEGRSVTEVFENLTKSILKAATQAALMGTGPLAGLFGSPAGPNGGAGGILGSLLGGLSQNPTGRYSGGPVKAGVGYDVGESGREKFVPTTPGRIIPNRKLGGGSVQVFDQRSMAAPPVETRRGPGGNPQIFVRDAYNSMQGEARRRGQRGPGYGVG